MHREWDIKRPIIHLARVACHPPPHHPWLLAAALLPSIKDPGLWGKFLQPTLGIV